MTSVVCLRAPPIGAVDEGQRVPQRASGRSTPSSSSGLIRRRPSTTRPGGACACPWSCTCTRVHAPITRVKPPAMRVRPDPLIPFKLRGSTFLHEEGLGEAGVRTRSTSGSATSGYPTRNALTATSRHTHRREPTSGGAHGSGRGTSRCGPGGTRGRGRCRTPLRGAGQRMVSTETGRRDRQVDRSTQAKSWAFAQTAAGDGGGVNGGGWGGREGIGWIGNRYRAGPGWRLQGGGCPPVCGSTRTRERRPCTGEWRTGPGTAPRTFHGIARCGTVGSTTAWGRWGHTEGGRRRHFRGCEREREPSPTYSTRRSGAGATPGSNGSYRTSKRGSCWT